MSVARIIAPSPVIVAAVAAMIFHFGAAWVASGVPIGFAAEFAAAIIIANYALEIIEQRAKGVEDYVVLSIETLTSAGRQRGWIFGGLAALAGVALINAASRMPPFLLHAAIALLLTALPLSAASLAVTHRWRFALNPKAWLEIATKLGLFLLAVVAVAYAAWFMTTLAFAQRRLWLEFVAAYAWFAAAYVIGYCLYAKRQALGVATQRAPEDLAAAEAALKLHARKEALGHAYAFAGRGNVQGALNHLRTYVQTEGEPIEAELWLFREMAKWEEPQPAITLGMSLAARLDDAGHTHEAAKVRSMNEELAKRVDTAQFAVPRG